MIGNSSVFFPIFILAKTGSPLTKTQINTKSSVLAVNTSKEIPHGGIVGSLKGHTVPEQKLNISKKMTTKGTSTFPPELGLFTYQIS